ncbi:hypothetical protein [Mycobacterium phage WXIN]|nr:hypothetical protein [Mycobacterium phage WXIN]
MSYTIAALDEAIENEDTPWEGDWGEFEEAADADYEYREVPANTEGAFEERYGANAGKWFKRFDKKRGVSLDGIGYAELIDQFGGEGKGDDYWFVIKVTDEAGEERFFRRNGYYASFHGSDLDGPTDEVKQQEKVITVWVKA